MPCTSARVVCGASSVGAVDAPHVHAKVTLFLLPMSASFVGKAIAGGRLVLAQFLLKALAADETIHLLDKRLRARKIMAAAARTGDVELLAWLYDTFHCCLDFAMIAEAVASGQVAALAWIMERLRPNYQRQGIEDEAASNTAVFNAHSEGRFRYDNLFRAVVGQLLSTAAGRGDLEIVHMLVEPALLRPRPDQSRPNPYTAVLVAVRSAVAAALRAGHVGVAQWLRECAPVVFDEAELEEIVHTAVDVRTTPYIHCAGCTLLDVANRCPLWRMVENAAHGRLDNVQWFHLNRSEHGCSHIAMDLAASNGHLDVVRWLHDNRTEGCTTGAMDGAASNGHLEIVRFLHEHRSEECTAKAVDGAAANGHLDVIRYLVENQLGEISARAMDGATANGHLDVLKWLMDHNSGDNADGGVVPTEAAMDRAASNGHLIVLEFLRGASSVCCSTAAIVEAAGHGHEDLLHWLLDQVGAERLSFDATAAAMKSAAKNGHTAIVRLLHEHWVGGLESSIDTGKSPAALRAALVVAAANGHLDTVKWLHHVIPDDLELPSPLIKGLDAAIRGRHLPVVRWIQRAADPGPDLPIRSSALDVAMVTAAKHADISMLEWIKEHRPDGHFAAANVPWARHASLLAAENGHLEVLQWFSMMYTGVFGVNGDTAWGRRGCIRMTSRGVVLTNEWLTWSEDSVGPI